MSFISSEFLVLFAVVLSLYFIIPFRAQNFLLLVVSLIFYSWWDWRFLGLMIFSATIDYISGLYLDMSRPQALTSSKRKLILFGALAVNLLILGLFKYFGFILDSMSALGATQLSRFKMNIVLPLGISFYTFQSMSYAVDVYRGRIAPIRNWLDYLLFVSFFPQLVAGPIERAGHLAGQLMNPRQCRLDDFYSGCQLLFAGTFKKMVIADNLSPIVDRVFAHSSPGAFDILIGVYAFAFQIFCDFSGYTDMARGMARMLGFSLTNNFNFPYFAQNPQDFWRRWHITLSSWFRDYVYIPLGGNQKGSGRHVFNLMLTMFLAGLWHGAAWTFVLWGLYHGLLLVAFHWWSSRKRFTPGDVDGLSRGLKVFLFFHLTCLGWLFFRATSVKQLVAFGSRFINDWSMQVLTSGDVYKVAVLIVPFVLFQMVQRRLETQEVWTFWSRPLQISFYSLLFYAILLFGTPQQVPFIYFQF